MSTEKTAIESNTSICQPPELLISKLSTKEIERAVNKKSSMAAQMARSAPSLHRKEMEKLFKIGLYVQHRFEQINHLSKQNINGAVAVFLYGVWSINNDGGRISGDAFSKLILSTEEFLTNWRCFQEQYTKSTGVKRQSLYETFAMIGNWLLMIRHHLNEQADDATLNGVKIMVREILIGSLKIEPESIDIESDGRLTIASVFE